MTNTTQGGNTYKAAIAKALLDGMSAHPKSFIMGQDIGSFSILGVTEGLAERFGAERVRDCPISESAMVGMAVGAAMKGWVGLLEIAYSDITAVAFSSIVHSAAKMRYATGGQLPCPVIIRAPILRWSRHGPMGTEVTASWYCNVPDLAIAMPATPAEAYWQLLAAFTRPVPTLILEDRALFAEEGLIGEAYDVEKARVLRAGTDLTLVAAGRPVKLAMDAAVQLAAAGVSAEVLSLGHVKPFDRDGLLAAAKRTGRVLVIQDEPPFGGYGVIAMAALAELAPGTLACAPKLLCRADTFLPHLLEEDHLPTVDAVILAARTLTHAQAQA